MNIQWMMRGACVAWACVQLTAAQADMPTDVQPEGTNTVLDAEWGDLSNIEVQGVALGMTKQDVVQKLGAVKASAYATGVPHVFKEIVDPTGIHYKITVYFGVAGTCSNKAVAIESMLYGATMADRNTVVETLQEKFGFEDDYLEHRPKGTTANLRDDYDSLPQYEQTINEHASVLLRVDRDNKKQRTYLLTVMYRHVFYNVTVDYLRMMRPDTGEAQRREQVKSIF